MSDFYLEPPEPEEEFEICTSCEYRDCICDMAYEKQKERELDDRD